MHQIVEVKCILNQRAKDRVWSYDASAAAFVHCKCLPNRHCHGKQKGTVKERTNEGVYVGCSKYCIVVLCVKKSL